MSELLDLRGKAALVTGAAGGIGAEIARCLARHGASVAIHYRRNAAEAQRLQRELAEEARVAAASGAGARLPPGGAPSAAVSAEARAVALQADLTCEAEVDALMAGTVHALGKLDILINSAGIYPTSPLAQMSHADWRATFAANADAVFSCTRAALPYLQNGSAIVNIGSIAALSPAPGHAHYSSAKAAVLAFTRSCAQELGPRGIRVNAVSPGLIGRPGLEEQWPDGVTRWRGKAPLASIGTAEDVANACLFLVSPAARWISGHNLVVDGGMLSAPIY